MHEDEMRRMIALFKSMIPAFGESTRGWLILAMASTLGGNLTLVAPSPT